MTVLDELPVADDVEVDHLAAGRGDAAPEPITGPLGARPDDDPAVNVPLVGVAAVLSTLGAGAMAAGLFRGAPAPHLVALLGVVIGVGITAWGHRPGAPRVLGYAALPVAVVTGAVIATAAGATGGLPRALGDALREGGLLQPPVAFEPGWRFLLLVLTAGLGAAAVSASVAFARPRLTAFVPVPLTIGAALLQPTGGELVPSLAGAFLTIAALAVSYGAELAADGASTGGFELRRLARAGAMLALLIAAVVAIAQTGFLFPDTEEEQVVPPQRPPSPPPTPDRVLFRTAPGERGPWRVGTLDGYDGEAFLLPPVDPGRLTEPAGDGRLAPDGGRPTRRVTFEIADAAGRRLPAPAEPLVIEGVGDGVRYDPRTATLELLEGRPDAGLTYTVTAAEPPDGSALGASPEPDPAVLAAFGEAPPPPNEVVALLEEAPTNRWDRLQFVRQRLYNTVVAAGAGRPTEVPPARVAAMLHDGAEATPYEITAAEVLLARWAGIPARVGYGYYGGEASADGLDFRPRHGAAWLEAYYEGHGWVPVIGTPPRAKSSLSDEERNEDPAVVPTDELGMVVYVPVRLQPLSLLYEAVRYWAVRAVPLLALLALAVASYPAGVKVLRTTRRRRWAAARGPAARIWASYAELRDRLYDLNVGDVRDSPLELRRSVAADEEHDELAWLVTRAMWGDLRRDLQETDAESAIEMARSVGSRITTEQRALNRVLARVSRTSLRDPYSDEVPNLWFAVPPTARLRQGARRVRRLETAPLRGLRGRVPVLGRLRPGPAAVLVLVAVGMALGGCATQAGFDGATVPVAYPDPLAPAILGAYDLIRQEDAEEQYAAPGDDALVSGGRVWTIRRGDAIDGSLQIALFEPDVDARNRAVQTSVEKGVGSGSFTTHRYGPVRLRHQELAEQQLWLWFPPTSNTMVLLVLRAGVEAQPLVHALVDHQLELPPATPGGSS